MKDYNDWSPRKLYDDGSLDDDENNDLPINDDKSDDGEPDYFNSPDAQAENPKKPKAPKYKPDDPRYYEGDDRWDHLKPRRRTRFYLWLAVTGVIIAGIVALYIRYFSPYIEGATQYGYVEGIEKRGMVFKTFEGVLLPYKELMDTTRLYHRDFIFTAADAHIATELKRAQLRRQPVRVEYKRYFGTLPWRGSSQIIITHVDSVDPRRILPPEFNGNKLPG